MIGELRNDEIYSSSAALTEPLPPTNRGHRLPSGGIVVAFDATPAGRRAVRVAARWAHRLDRSLTIITTQRSLPVSVLNPALAGNAAWLRPHLLSQGLRRLTEGLLQSYPNLSTDVRTVRGSVGENLLRASEDGHLVVSGTRGRGVPAAILAGSVADDVVRRSSVAAMVVPASGRPHGPVLAAVNIVSGQLVPAAEPVLATAFEVARAFGVPLTITTIWSRWAATDAIALRELAGTEHPEVVSQALTRALQEATADLTAAQPETPVTIIVETGQPQWELLRASHRASTLVVGYEHRGTSTGLFRSSTSRAVSQLAHCPVLICPHGVHGHADRAAR